MRHEQEILMEMLGDVINEYAEREGYTTTAFYEVQQVLRCAATVLVFKKYTGALERAAVLARLCAAFEATCRHAVGDGYDELDAANRRQQRDEK